MNWHNNRESIMRSPMLVLRETVGQIPTFVLQETAGKEICFLVKPDISEL